MGHMDLSKPRVTAGPPFDSSGAVRANLELMGKPIGAYDILIAGQALRHGLTLVTANASEFSRVKGLDWQDWTKGRFSLEGH
jgi:predicted nucleic acid-binding protein